jgi:hypothetical protein
LLKGNCKPPFECSLLYTLSKYCYSSSPLLFLSPIILIPLYEHHISFSDGSWLSMNSYFIYNRLTPNHSQLFTHQLRVSLSTYLFYLSFISYCSSLYNRLELLNTSYLPTTEISFIILLMLFDENC